MKTIEIIILNFDEIRRRSIKLWDGLPAEKYDWKPDAAAMGSLEMIRHVLEGEHLFHVIITNRGNLGDYVSPWENRPYTNFKAELEFANKYRNEFIDAVNNFSETDLENIEIVRSEKNQRKKLGDYLNRMAYHESVHTGQMLSYFRGMGIEIPLIWD